jgi:hypothetical protein
MMMGLRRLSLATDPAMQVNRGVVGTTLAGYPTVFGRFGLAAPGKPADGARNRHLTTTAKKQGRHWRGPVFS